MITTSATSQNWKKKKKKNPAARHSGKYGEHYVFGGCYRKCHAHHAFHTCPKCFHGFPKHGALMGGHVIPQNVGPNEN
jgi:hypothetical protein